MQTRILRILPVLAVFGAFLPASAQAQAPPTGGTPIPPPSPFALSGKGHVLLGHAVRFRGAVERSDAGRTVTIEQRDPLTRIWGPVATTTAAPDGSFVASWQPRHSGRFQTRAVVARDGGAAAAAASPELALTIYKPALATWYGPGFFGKRTACGIKLTRDLVGVAHRRLPCGTNVALRYRGRIVVVPVVDRGPFRRGTDWDLTAATAQALGFTETSRLGAVSLR
jgi:rare lipoprotein A